MLNAYGSRCACCGENDAIVLDLDHLDPYWVDAATPRPAEEAGTSLYVAVAEAGFPATYQLLCRNCNWSKRLHGQCRMAHTEHAACYLVNLSVSAYRRRSGLRRQVITAYGGCCSDCGLVDLDVLDVDHIDGGGKTERRTLSHDQLWARLRRENFPPGYRVLCRNCNWRAWRRRQAGMAHDTPLPESLIA